MILNVDKWFIYLYKGYLVTFYTFIVILELIAYPFYNSYRFLKKRVNRKIDQHMLQKRTKSYDR